MMRRWIVVGIFAFVAACATVEGTPITLDDTSKHLLSGTWVGNFERRGAITGNVFHNSQVTFVITGASATKSTYRTSLGEGTLDLRVSNGKAIVTFVTHSLPDRVYTLSRGQDGSLYLQARWNATATDSEGRTWPQIHSVFLTKQ